MTIVGTINKIAEDLGGEPGARNNVQCAMNAVTDALAGEDVPIQKSIESEIRVLGEKIVDAVSGGGGYGFPISLDFSAADEEGFSYISFYVYSSQEQYENNDLALFHCTNKSIDSYDPLWIPGGMYVLVHIQASSDYSGRKLNLRQMDGSIEEFTDFTAQYSALDPSTRFEFVAPNIPDDGSGDFIMACIIMAAEV